MSDSDSDSDFDEAKEQRFLKNFEEEARLIAQQLLPAKSCTRYEKYTANSSRGVNVRKLQSTTKVSCWFILTN